MKIRSDFVTNSSSSSFICVKVNSFLEDKILEQNGINIDELCELWEENDYEDFNLKGGLTCVISEGGDVSYIGFDIAEGLYDKTVNQHKEDLVKILKDEYDINTIPKDIYFDYGEIYR